MKVRCIHPIRTTAYRSDNLSSRDLLPRTHRADLEVTIKGIDKGNLPILLAVGMTHDHDIAPALFVIL